MKKILVINNTILYQENNQLYLNRETGKFFLELKDLGFDVSTFQINQLKTEEDSFANFSISNRKLKIYTVFRRKSRLIAFVKAFFMIQKAILKNQFIYIYYPGPICKVIALCCIIYKKPYGLYIRGEQSINTKVSNFLLKKAKIILTISDKFTHEISKTNSNTQTIRPMIGFNESDIVSQKSYTVNQLKLLYVGRIVFDKGVFELIEAMRIFKEKKYDITLTIVGNGTDLIQLKEKVKEYNLENSIIFLGMISDKDELMSIYKVNDVFVLPTYHEGFPRVLYEAMIMHLGIITTFVGTINYLMNENKNCLKIDVNSYQSIVDKVEEFYFNSSILSEIALKGSETVSAYLKNKKLSHAKQLQQFINKI